MQRLLILLALYRVRKLLDGDMRLRTACDLEPLDRDNLIANRPEGYRIPALPELADAVKEAVGECRAMMVHTTVTFEDELKKSKDEKKPKGEDSDSADDEDSDTEDN